MTTGTKVKMETWRKRQMLLGTAKNVVVREGKKVGMVMERMVALGVRGGDRE